MNDLMAGLAVAAATLMVLGYLAFIWWLDRYEREPIWLVGLTFIWGALGGTCFGCALSLGPAALATMALGQDLGTVVSVVVVAPLSEELTKGLIFIPLVLTRHFDNQTDGMIYGAATGLGFAALENLAYFAGAGDVETLYSMILIRTLFTALVHCISSAALGMAIGYARHRAGAGFLLIAGGYVLAVLNHAMWNGIATAAGFLGESALGAGLLLVGCALVALAAIVMFAVTQWSLKREHDVIRRYLEQEAKQGVLPMEHARIIPYWTRRRRKNWLPPEVNKPLYIKLATLLAFRHHQLEIAEGERRERYLADIASYRDRLKKLLERRS